MTFTATVRLGRRQACARRIDTMRADRFDRSGLPPNRRSWLARTGRQQTNQALARMAPERTDQSHTERYYIPLSLLHNRVTSK